MKRKWDVNNLIGGGVRPFFLKGGINDKERRGKRVVVDEDVVPVAERVRGGGPGEVRVHLDAASQPARGFVKFNPFLGSGVVRNDLFRVGREGSTKRSGCFAPSLQHAEVKMIPTVRILLMLD